jgi:putative ABC transport system permease protein
MIGWLRQWLHRLRSGFRRAQLDGDLDAELRSHLEMAFERNLAQGMSSEQARRQALLDFGGLEQTRQSCREARGLPFLDSLLHDLHFAFRMLGKSPGFTAIAALSLALGMGGTTTLFSVVNSVLLRPLPYQNSRRLLRIEETHPRSSSIAVTYATFLDLQRQARTIENASAYREWIFNVTGRAEPAQISGALVSGNFFASLGATPMLGRTILPEDDQPGASNQVVILSYSLWRSRFGADPHILGQTLMVNAEPYSVLGVMPPGFAFPNQSEMWCPLVPGGGFHDNRRAHLLTVLADVARGKSNGEVSGELTAFAKRVEERNPGLDDPVLSLAAIPLQRSLTAPVRPALVILFFAVGLLLVIACANVANLLLARTAARSKEIAVRLALGAGRVRLVTLFLTESVLMSLLGGTLGLLLAQAGLGFIRTLNSETLPRFAEIQLDWRVFAFASAISVLSGLLFGLAPALSGSKLDLNAPLKETHSEVAGSSRRISSDMLTVLQFGLAMILLAGAGLLGSSLLRVLRVNPGFNPERLLTLQVFLSPVKYPEGGSQSGTALHEMLESIRTLPGVRSAGVVNCLPITGGVGTDFVIEGRPAPRIGDEPGADIRVADYKYFSTMGIPLLRGRVFTEHDDRAAARVVVINETMTRTFWPNQNPLGQRITMKDWGPPLTAQIIGVVGDVKTNGLDEPVGPMIYWSYYQFGTVFNRIVVRAEDDPLRLVSAVKSRIWSVDKDQPVSQIATMDEILSQSLERRRLYLVLLGVFAGLALLLAATGIYGVVSYSVTRRTREMGIRVALGAERLDVLGLILLQAAKLALTGEFFGILVALAVTRLMSSMLFGVSAADPWTFAGAVVLLTAVAFAACYIPGRRAMRVDPIVALRYE